MQQSRQPVLGVVGTKAWKVIGSLHKNEQTAARNALMVSDSRQQAYLAVKVCQISVVSVSVADTDNVNYSTILTSGCQARLAAACRFSNL